MKCTKCNKDKKIADFYKGYANCKACELTYQRAWRKKKRAKERKKATPITKTFVKPKAEPKTSAAKCFLLVSIRSFRLTQGAEIGSF